MRKYLLLLVLPLAACNPSASRSPIPSATEQEAVLMVTVKHYFQVFNQVRASNDASLIDSVTDPDGVDRSNTQAFVRQQVAEHRASITTREVFSNWKFVINGVASTVYYDYQASGYDVNAETKQPLENEITLQPHREQIEFRLHGKLWLVFNRQPA